MAVVCLLVPTWSLATRVIYHFVADFDATVDPGSEAPPEFEAKGGTLTVQGPPNIFDIVVDGSGAGAVIIAENPFGMAGTLTGSLDEPSYDSVIDIDVLLTPGASVSELTVALIDDNGGGMIDLEFDDEDGGKIIVNGQTVHISSGGEGSGPIGPITVGMHLTASMLNVNSYTVTVSGSFGSHEFSGFLPLSGPLSLAKVKFVRPGNVAGGTWTMDNLVVSSPIQGGLVAN